MPYIKSHLRPDIDAVIAQLPVSNMEAGEKNYAITRMIDNDLEANGIQYAYINEWIGVLQCVQLELYRRIAAPYEDKKINENGDVYNARP